MSFIGGFTISLLCLNACEREEEGEEGGGEGDSQESPFTQAL